MKKVKTLSREKLLHALDALIKKYQLFAPVKDDTILTFAEVKKSSEIIMDFTNSAGSPKKIFFPQSETIISYSRDGSRHVPEYAGEKKRIVFGMRPCDAKALTLLDKVFD
ncbi:MAG: 4Fe-4S ferredoxin, partial [Planctomycetes bacterium]|nr:4Fe-4S ferredoxin [Planctomycetota bacterium]